MVLDVSCSVLDIQNWQKEIRVREAVDKRSELNDYDSEVRLVAERVCNGMDALCADESESSPEPLRWSMHGGPGTGETVIQMIKGEFFEHVWKWNIGETFPFVALQAVVADVFFRGHN